MAIQDKTATAGMTKDEICIHYGDECDKRFGAVGTVIYQTSLFTRKRTNHGYAYTRVNNPTIEVPERKIAALEKGEAALVFSSGMAAISSAILSVLAQGDHAICVDTAYISSRLMLGEYLGRFGVETTFVYGERPEEFEAAIRPNTKLIYLESPSSNIFLLQDIRAITQIARARGIVTILDNTWATPMFQNPIEMGVDMVAHSCSKYLGGHSDLVAGVLVGTQERMAHITGHERATLGGCIDPQGAALLTRGLRTLPVRMRTHQANGLAVARYLESHPKVARVLYPGLASFPQYELGKRQFTGYTGLMSFILKTKSKHLGTFIKDLRHFEEGPSWGGHECLLNTPGMNIDEETSKKTHIPDGLVRVSIGLEDMETILEDFEQALAKIPE